MINTEVVGDLIVDRLRAVLDEMGVDEPGVLGPDTPLLGTGSIVDSVGLVSLLLEIEEALEDIGVTEVSLTSEDALSRRHSPFRTVGTLTDYVVELASRR